jgi:hypothetical protein
VLSAILALAVAVQSAGAPAQQRQNRDRRTWYQAYADAQRDIQQRNWQSALDNLDAAVRLGAPRPGRNVNFYGDVYRDYNPDYYRGVALSNLQRYAEADQAFERVRQAQLIVQRDPLFGEFEKQAANVKDSVQKQAGANAPPRPVNPPGTRPADVNSAGPASPPSSPNAANVARPAAANAPANPPTPAAVQRPGTATNAAAAPVAQRPLSPEEQKAAEATRTPQRPASTPRPTANARPTPAANPVATPGVAPPAPVVVPPATLPRVTERDAVLRYFAGDYEGAASALGQLAATPNASSRVYLYLACSRAAMALTGLAPRTSLDEARVAVARAGALGPFARDLELISPRIRQELRLQP